MNEKRNAAEPALDPDLPETRTRSDVAPKQTLESGAPPRHISGLRPALHLQDMPTVPPAPLTPADLLEDGWEEDADSSPTLLDPHASVPPDLVAQARAISDPVGDELDSPTNDLRTRELATRELSTRMIPRDEAPTGELPTVEKLLPPLAPPSVPFEDPDEEFDHDDFPTRQTANAVQDALLAFPLPTDSHRGLHETLPAPEESTPEGIPVLVAPMTMRPDDTAQMPVARALPRLDGHSVPPPSESSQVSQVSQISQPSYPSHAPLIYPTPTSITGAPLLPANTVRFEFLRNLSPNNDPPVNRLALVAAVSFLTTLAISAFVAWVIVLVRH